MGMLDSIIGMLGGQQSGDFNSRFGAFPPNSEVDPVTGRIIPPAPQRSGFPGGDVSGMLMGGKDASPSWREIDRTTPRPAMPWSASPTPFQNDGNMIGAGDTPAFGALAPAQTAAPALPPPITVQPPPGGVSARDDAALPPNATPTVGDAQNLPFSISPPGAFDHVAARSAPTDAAAAAPALSAPSVLSSLSGIGKGIGGVLQGIGGVLSPEVRAQNMTTAALVKKGLDPEMAAAIAMNPTLMQQIVPQLFGPKAYQHVSIKDAFGNEIPLSYDPSAARYLNANGKPFGVPGDGTPGVPGAGDFLAKGVTNVNHDLQGEDYLKQFSPEVQAGVKNYLDGKTLTTGNARQGFTQTVKMIAQKYGADIGKPADDIAVNARRQMSNDLSKGTPGSLGGQITFGGTSLGHLADVAEKATKADLSTGGGIPILAQLANKVRSGLSTEQAAKVNDMSGAIQHYGQEITKFYTGSPGGEGERMRFLKTMDTAKSPQEIAGAIRAERDLIPDRLRQIEQQITDRLGPEEAAKQMKRVDLQGVVGRINQSLAKLDPTGPEAKMMGGQPAGAGAPTAAAPPAGRTTTNIPWSIVH